MRLKIIAVLIAFTGSFYGWSANAQQVHRISGIVRDSANVTIPNAIVRLIAGKDTLKSSTDTAGKFTFINLKSSTVSLLVRSIGYQPFSKDYSLTTATQQLPQVILKAESQQLNEVVIKGKVIPMRLMKDTVEFNAQAYSVRENDRVSDLLQQLPGMEVDKDGNATTEGKTLTKIRVNGKDFFTGNVKEFIDKLPANIVDKLQVIDDYGDKANFTGIKSGSAQKILNLVLKPKMNRGLFGKGVLSAGTNDRYALNLGTNIWQETEQIGLNADASNTNNGAGLNTNANLSADYRNNLGKKFMINGNYSYGYNKNQLLQESYITTVNKLGTVFNNTSNSSSGNSNNHNFGLNLQSMDPVNFLQADVRGTLSNSLNNSLSSSMQTGAIRQDLITRSQNNQRSPNLNANFVAGRKFKKEGRNLTAGATFSSTLDNGDDHLYNEIGYYPDSATNVKTNTIRDNLVNTANRTQAVNGNFTFTEPLGTPKDTTATRNIDFTYQFALRHTGNELVTNANEDGGLLNRIDSLSNSYTSNFTTHTVGINYRYTAAKLNYSIGLTGQSNLLTGAYAGRDDRINRSGFNFSPLARVFYKFSPTDMLTLNYDGNSTAPDFNQLQPVRDTRNLQNVIIGNPELKAAFNHNANVTYRTVNTKNGQTLQLSLNGRMVQDQVVSNTVLVPDTLNSYKQETRYLNTGGNYSFGTTYNWSLPFGNKKYNVDFRGGATYSHQVSFTDNEKNFGEGLNLSQSMAFRMNRKWIRLNSNISYSYRSNAYSVPTSPSNRIQTWMMNTEARTFILKSLTAGISAAKTINQGYSLAAPNPLIINGFVEKTFFKNRMASLKIEGNDLLKEGNTVNNSISGNTITESRSNQVTRYFLLSLNIRLDRFGAVRNYRGDDDDERSM